MQIQPLLEGKFFHIYNRGVNSVDIFKEKKIITFYNDTLFIVQVLELYASWLLKIIFICCICKGKCEVPGKMVRGCPVKCLKTPPISIRPHRPSI